MIVTREMIQQEARTWLGVRWKHQGRNRNCGIDCVGIILNVAKSLSLFPEELDEFGYNRRATGYDFLDKFKQRQELEEVDVMKPKVGDLLIFTDGNYPCHCGISTIKWDIPFFIHSHAFHRVVMEQEYPWKKGKINPQFAIAAFRFKEVTS